VAEEMLEAAQVGGKALMQGQTTDEAPAESLTQTVSR
jgi:hypothetical protein